MLELANSKKLLTTVNNNIFKLNLNENEWKEIQEFCDFLKPFFEFTEVMSGSTYPTSGTLILLLDHLSEHLNEIYNFRNTPNWIKDIAEAMITKFNSISENLYNPTAYLALILDPRYKMQILPNSANIETLKELINTNKRKPAGIIEQMLTKKLKNNNLSSVNEIEEFLTINVEPTNINPCEWWKHHRLQYPILSKVARDYLCMPATSVPSEQAFSKSGKLISKKRNRLGDHAVEASSKFNKFYK
ncbi:7555_t:CDS:2 [Entrophospora sp. SA101]|nr:7555_t:CDS:2 [Entrophospora sp. SA101]